MTSHFESIKRVALEAVTGGMNDGAVPEGDEASEIYAPDDARAKRRDDFTTGGTIEGGGPFTTGGSF